MTKSNFFKSLSATAQFILGFVLGISLIAGISGAAIYAYYKKMSVLPEKPDFSRAVASQKSASDIDEPAVNIEPLESNVTEEEVVESQVAEEPIEEPQTTLAEPEEPDEPEPELPPNAYRAVVTWPEGLSLRAKPSVNSGRVGGIGANATIIILEDSADGKWQRVRLPWSNQEGWVKAGNIRRTSY
ncbi:SH3 domain-containing protein [Pleurocapsales cyanobacterium LEGE 10410]|nr:SH3 domain-containing protein [Pleurocapsales cyanobacterium LEGE 10410]